MKYKAILLLILVLAVSLAGCTIGSGKAYTATFAQKDAGALGFSDAAKASFEAQLESYGFSVAFTSVEGNLLTVSLMAQEDPTARLESLINSLNSNYAGKMSVLFEGREVLNSADVAAVITDPQHGYGIMARNNTYQWYVPFNITHEAAQRFADAVNGKCTLAEDDGRCEEYVEIYLGSEFISKVYLTEDVTQGMLVVTPTITGANSTQEAATSEMNRIAAALKAVPPLRLVSITETE